MRILIADDNECLRLLLAVVLHGHDVIVAGDGAEAVELAERKRPDIILMDVMMPEMDGFEALRQLKANEATADIPVILMSAGCVRQQDVERGPGLGAEDYLKKPFPFDINDLPKKLEGYIARAKKKARDGPGLHL
jgi:CheY-like chemotaxis protein